MYLPSIMALTHIETEKYLKSEAYHKVKEAKNLGQRYILVMLLT